jgi:hypothetical protein
LLAEVTDSVQVVLYMRPQHELALSLYSTMLRKGVPVSSVFPQDPVGRDSYDYEGSLNRWSQAFGAPHVVPRIFSPTELMNGDVCADFMHLIGADGSKLTSVPRRNESLSLEAQLFLAHINPRLPSFRAKNVNPARSDLARTVAEAFPGKGYQPARADAEQFFALFAATNERIRARWFPDRKALFEVSFDHFPTVASSTTLTLDQAFDMFARLWSAKQ